MPEHKYGKRVCLQCGKDFEAKRPAQITCSMNCILERRREQKRQTNARYRVKRKKYLLELLAELDTVYAELEWLNCWCEEERKAHCNTIKALSISHADTVGGLKVELKKAREERDAYRSASEKLNAKPKEAHAPKVTEPLPPLKECPRMHLRATTLPCGEREECFTPLCEKLGGVPSSKPALGDRVCPVCKKPFTPKSPAQKFCSADCRLKGKKQA